MEKILYQHILLHWLKCFKKQTVSHFRLEINKKKMLHRERERECSFIPSKSKSIYFLQGGDLVWKKKLKY